MGKSGSRQQAREQGQGSSQPVSVQTLRDVWVPFNVWEVFLKSNMCRRSVFQHVCVSRAVIICRFELAFLYLFY